jgi:hypothetical protein
VSLGHDAPRGADLNQTWESGVGLGDFAIDRPIGRRISQSQIGDNCRVVPAQVTSNNDSKLMLGNRKVGRR